MIKFASLLHFLFMGDIALLLVVVKSVWFYHYHICGLGKIFSHNRLRQIGLASLEWVFFFRRCIFILNNESYMAYFASVSVLQFQSIEPTRKDIVVEFWFNRLLRWWGSKYVKIFQIRSFFWSVFSCIRTEYRRMRTRKNSVFGQFSRSV